MQSVKNVYILQSELATAENFEKKNMIFLDALFLTKDVHREILRRLVLKSNNKNLFDLLVM